MDKARAYVENWKEAYRNNTGLLLFGDVGTGKSFFAGCIANALLDRDVPVLMTNFPTILNRLTGMFSEDRADCIASFGEYDLLIIDDLGVERSTGVCDGADVFSSLTPLSQPQAHDYHHQPEAGRTQEPA